MSRTDVSMFAAMDREQLAEHLRIERAAHELTAEYAEDLAAQVDALRQSIWAEVAAERGRAHLKHGATSMEAMPVTDMTRLSVLLEELGEVAREFNEARHRAGPGLLLETERGNAVDLAALRKELIQVAAMAGAWADAIPAVPD